MQLVVGVGTASCGTVAASIVQCSSLDTKAAACAAPWSTSSTLPKIALT